MASLASATTRLDPAATVEPLGGEVNIYDLISVSGPDAVAFGREVEQGVVS